MPGFLQTPKRVTCGNFIKNNIKVYVSYPSLTTTTRMTDREHAIDAILPRIMETITDAIATTGSAWIGIGTGTTIALFMDKFKTRLHAAQLVRQCFAIATSFQAQQLIMDSGMTLAALSQAPNGELDIAIDGADEVDSSGAFAIKGGGGAHLLEKIVALSARLFIIIVDSTKVGMFHCLGHKVFR